MDLSVLAEESYRDLMTSVPHILFELTLEAATFVLGAIFGRPVLRRWRERLVSRLHREIDAEHGVEHADPGASLYDAEQDAVERRAAREARLAPDGGPPGYAPLPRDADPRAGDKVWSAFFGEWLTVHAIYSLGSRQGWTFHHPTRGTSLSQTPLAWFAGQGLVWRKEGSS